MQQPSKQQVDKALADLEKHPTRQLAAGLIATHRQQTESDNHLPVDAIIARYQAQLDGLVGKH